MNIEHKFSIFVNDVRKHIFGSARQSMVINSFQKYGMTATHVGEIQYLFDINGKFLLSENVDCQANGRTDSHVIEKEKRDLRNTLKNFSYKKMQIKGKATRQRNSENITNEIFAYLKNKKEWLSPARIGMDFGYSERSGACFAAKRCIVLYKQGKLLKNARGCYKIKPK